ncbi:MAG: transcriptional repressor [Candidatus Margulisiibacteriota bacterium]|nr:transcriptional repressor [Candidatus Margulisiibacteriota bacterium]
MLDYFKKYLEQKSLKLTRQRTAIAQMFLAKKGHICVDELYYTLRKKYPSIGHTTVYRTIKLLKNAKIAAEMNFTGKRKRFEQVLDRKHHDHFICRKCGKVIEFFDSDLERRQEKICKKYNFDSKQHQMQIFSICGKCQGKGK